MAFKNFGKTLTEAPLNQLAYGIICFAILIIVGMWLSIEALIKHDHDEAIEDVIRQNTNLARVFEEHTIRTLGGIDEILLTLKRRFETEGEDFDMPGLWSRMLVNPNIIRNALITDPSGMAILGNAPIPRISFADREHINTHFTSDSGELFIGKSVVARLSKQWSIALSRRANNPDGSLKGVISVMVNPFYFSDFYKDVDLGQSGFIGLAGLDGFGRVRRAEGPFDLGLDLSKSELFRRLAIKPNDSYISSTLFDGVERIISYRTVRGYPLLVSVGIAKDEALAGFMREAYLHRIFAALASIVISVFAAAMIGYGARARRHQLMSEKAAAEMAAAKEAAETANKFLHGFADYLPVLISYVDTERRFRFINKTGALWYARPSEDIVGRRTSEVRQLPLALSNETLFKLLAKGTVRRESTHQYPDGVVRTVETNLVPDIDRSGRVQGFYRVATDITERRRLDEQLREAQKMEAIGHLTGGIAHDFNNLLMVIIGNLDNLSESGSLPPKMLAFVNTALRVALRGADLTKQLLSFARKQSLSPVVTDLNVHVAEIGELLQRTLPESITIDVLAHPTPVLTLVDPSQLKNALLNLGLNSRDAMKQGGLLLIKVGIEDKQAADSTGKANVPAERYAVIEVRDTGTGMTPEVMAKAFEPFFTTKPMGEGTGLGLSMVYGFVHQSGGHIQLSSAPGKGTAVRLQFPLSEERSEKHAPSADRPRPASSLDLRRSGTRRRILVVEDMPDVMTTVTDMLVGLGYDVVTAVDAHSALEILAQPEPVDGMLTDIGLPNAMNGVSLAKTATDILPNLKIATMSGYKDQQSHGEAEITPPWIHLTKPFLRADLAMAMTVLFAAEPDLARGDPAK